uniref:Uncharacterized protein n=1 Tax=Anguilla anguilla TaxID=7936 RepID=A0A0E9UGF1_ANGAN
MWGGAQTHSKVSFRLAYDEGLFVLFFLLSI